MKTLLFVICAFYSISCSGSAAYKKCQEPAHRNTASCVALNSVVDCTTDSLQPLIKEFTPVVIGLVKEATGGDGLVDWAHVKDSLKDFTMSKGACIVASVVSGLMNAPPRLAPGEILPKREDLRTGFAGMKAALWPGATFHTAQGDL